ncbi:hypothetical protein BDV93DRAFT_545237 [Ceratobasidium sp. AG-I]|nr:hypothetical protein BDV93DRAFT_545237 [Ceratobasidium sp. AG-I]
MSDFADLWNSVTPTTGKKPPGGESLSSQLLASKGSGLQAGSQPTSRVATPSYLAAQGLSPQPSGPSYRPNSRTGGTSAQPTSNATSGDAFGDLLSLSTHGQSKNMTIAERKAQADRERAKAEEEARKEREAHGAFWDKFETTTSGPAASASNQFSAISAPMPHQQASRINPTLLVPSRVSPLSSTQTSANRATPVSNSDPWDLDTFLAPSKPVSQAPTPSSNVSPVQSSSRGAADLFDLLDPSSSGLPTARSRSSRSSPVRSGTPGDFDWGNREDQDDLLGDLSKPVSEVSRTPKIRTPSNGQRATEGSQPGRATSPPPHILGQIVEMGFSLQQAKQALANTSTGVDVQAALDSLLAGSTSGVPGGQDLDANDLERFREEDAAARREQEQEEAERRRRRRAGPSRSAVLQQPNEESASQLQDRADQLLAQASVIGASVFSRANALWKEGKEKAMKVYEERAATTGSNTPVNSRDPGRPAWMRDEEDISAERQNEEAPSRPGFWDEEEDSVFPPRPQPQQPRHPSPSLQPSQRQQPQPSPVSTTGLSRPADKLASLFSDTTAYVSPSRRKTPSQAQTPVQPSPIERRPASPLPPPRVRTNPPVSTNALASAQTHRTKGTDAFKLGQYGAAVDSYTAALALLPEGHLVRIPLLNNRAAARAKAGDATGSIEDCTAVLTMLGEEFDPRHETPTADVDLGAAALKALRRRAEVLESTEKWTRAREDWERIIKVGGTWAGGKAGSDGVQGAGRCRRMEDGGDAPSLRPRVPAASKPKPRPRPVPARATSSKPEDSAVHRLKVANAAAEAEEEQKHSLKDSVDARIVSWKGGKENNIRALIASLDTVLWPELGWAKVGMHELVMPNQVKIKYVRAIAKVHPDKLNTSSTTVEQRMIANSVFGALNEAWNAFVQ